MFSICNDRREFIMHISLATTDLAFPNPNDIYRSHLEMRTSCHSEIRRFLRVAPKNLVMQQHDPKKSGSFHHEILHGSALNNKRASGWQKATSHFEVRTWSTNKLCDNSLLPLREKVVRSTGWGVRQRAKAIILGDFYFPSSACRQHRTQGEKGNPFDVNDKQLRISKLIGYIP